METRSWLNTGWVWAVALCLAALTLGMTFAHTLELAPKMSYGPQLWTRINQSLYPYFAFVGGPVEVANAILLALLAARAYRARAPLLPIMVAAGGFAAALLVWFTVVNPANGEIASWSARAVPVSWEAWRARWEFGHAARFALMLAGYVGLVKAALDRRYLTSSRSPLGAGMPGTRAGKARTGRARPEHPKLGEGEQDETQNGPDRVIRALAAAMLVFLCYPALTLASGPVSPGPVAEMAGVTITVVVLYLWAVWHRHRPPLLTWPVLGAMVAAGVALPLAQGPDWTGLLLFPVVASAVTMRARAGVAVVLALVALLAGEGLALHADAGMVLSLSLVSALTGLGAAGCARLVEVNGELRVARTEIARLASAEERARLGRDLHDAVKQELFAASMELGITRQVLETDPDSARRHAEDAARAVETAKEQLATLISQTRNGESAGTALVEQLRGSLMDWSARCHLRSSFSAPESVACPVPVAAALVRAAREALTNVGRHARATAVTVALRTDHGGVELRITDDGIGIQPGLPGSHGHGLDIMREQLSAVGACAEVHSSPGHGTELICRWPASPLQPEK